MFLHAAQVIFQSTPSAWRETGNLPQYHRCRGISIHSLRMEGDLVKRLVSDLMQEFQSTPSAWRETSVSPVKIPTKTSFQSTPSAWRETLRIAWYICMDAHFNPLPPHGGRPIKSETRCNDDIFQSTPSAWRETGFGACLRWRNSDLHPNPTAGRRT